MQSLLVHDIAHAYTEILGVDYALCFRHHRGAFVFAQDFEIVQGSILWSWAPAGFLLVRHEAPLPRDRMRRLILVWIVILALKAHT